MDSLNYKIHLWLNACSITHFCCFSLINEGEISSIIIESVYFDRVLKYAMSNGFVISILPPVFSSIKGNSYFQIKVLPKQ